MTFVRSPSNSELKTQLSLKLRTQITTQLDSEAQIARVMQSVGECHQDAIAIYDNLSAGDFQFYLHYHSCNVVQCIYIFSLHVTNGFTLVGVEHVMMLNPEIQTTNRLGIGNSFQV